MKGKSPCQSDLDLFEPHLIHMIDADHPLSVLSRIFPWNDIESEYTVLYSDRGAPSKPVRLMAGLLVLKQIFNGTDEGIVSEWQRDKYFQYFCGGSVMVRRPPCSASDLTRFRKRIGRVRVSGLMKILALYRQKAGIDKLKIAGNSKPGQDGFSYSVRAGLSRFFRKWIRTWGRQAVRAIFFP
jgi:transposase, IS5 family